MSGISNNSAKTNRSLLDRLLGPNHDNEVVVKNPTQSPIRHTFDKFAKLEDASSDVSVNIPESPVSKLHSCNLSDDDVNSILKNDDIASLLKNPGVRVKEFPESSFFNQVKDVLSSPENFANALKSFLNLSGEQLKAALESQQKSNEADREIALVMAILTFSTVSPDSVVNSLKNFPFKSSEGKAMAEGSIASVAAFGQEMALKAAKNKGDTTLARAMVAALKSGPIQYMCDRCNHSDGHNHVESLANNNISNSENPVESNINNTFTDSPKLVLTDTNSGEPLAVLARKPDGEFTLLRPEEVFYESEEDCPSDCEIGSNLYTTANAAQAIEAESTENKAEGLAGEHNQNIKSKGLLESLVQALKDKVNYATTAQEKSVAKSELKTAESQIEAAASRLLGLV